MKAAPPSRIPIYCDGRITESSQTSFGTYLKCNLKKIISFFFTHKFNCYRHVHHMCAMPIVASRGKKILQKWVLEQNLGSLKEH